MRDEHSDIKSELTVSHLSSPISQKNMKKRLNKQLNYGLIVITLLATTACGWQLRGGIDARGLDNIAIVARNSQSNFAKALNNAVGKPQGAVTENADYQLLIVDENSISRTASITSSARAAEYLVVEEATIRILGKGGEVLLPDTVLRAERSLDFDENQIIGKSEEVNLVKGELLNDLVRQVISRLQRLTSN